MQYLPRQYPGLASFYGYEQNDVTANYNALEVRLEKRFFSVLCVSHVCISVSKWAVLCVSCNVCRVCDVCVYPMSVIVCVCVCVCVCVSLMYN